MVDSRAKGARAESQMKGLLISKTKLGWERIPASGALSEVHGLKGDLYVPGEKNLYCVEVKSYKESAINHNLVIGVGKPLLEWMQQSIRQAEQVSKKPILFFKHDRSKWFVCSWEEPEAVDRWLVYQYDLAEDPVYIMGAEDWLNLEETKWIL